MFYLHRTSFTKQYKCLTCTLLLFSLWCFCELHSYFIYLSQKYVLPSDISWLYLSVAHVKAGLVFCWCWNELFYLIFIIITTVSPSYIVVHEGSCRHCILLHLLLYPSILMTRLPTGLQGKGFFLVATASRPPLGPTQPPIQRVPGNLSGC